jgi:hypothetical protein
LVRLRARILDWLADLGWDLLKHASLIRKQVRGEHTFDGKKVARRG